MREAVAIPFVSACLLFVLPGCSVAMALHGNPEPNFKAFEVGSSRQVVEIQLGKPIASQVLDDGRKRDTYQFEMGNSPNGHRALMNLYIDFATIGIWELPGTIIEARMGRKEESQIIYTAEDRVAVIEGYAPPAPSAALQESIEAHEKWDRSEPAK